MAEVGGQNGQKAKSDKDVDLCNAKRDVWLVKVPKYIADRWESTPALSSVGKIKIKRHAHPGHAPGKPSVTLTLDDHISQARKSQNKAQDPAAKSNFHVWSTTLKEIPKEHKFAIQTVASQHLAVLSDMKQDAGSGTQLCVEGRVTQRAECTPISDQLYLNLKREALLKPTETARKVQKINKLVRSYKPVANHASNIANEQKKKMEGKKSRDDKEKVMEHLFALFEKHQYYNIKDLVKETRQPVTYLKVILNEMCRYNVKNPHKNMWELKPEYRHYKKSDKEGEGASNDDSSDDGFE